MILNAPEDVTPEALTAVLRASAAIREASVVNVVFEPIGIGLMGETVRFEIVYDRSEFGQPATVIGKFPAIEPGAREIGANWGAYMNEVRFYQEIAPKLAVQTARCYYAGITPDATKFCLLLEDMAPARAPDQMLGCSRSDAEQAMIQAAALHAPHFCDHSLWDVDWMKQRRKVMAIMCGDFQKHVAVFRERYADILEPEYLELIQSFSAVVGRFASGQPERFALAHADFRIDNMLFDAQNGLVPLVVLDWQSIAPENPGIDIAYFMATSYPTNWRSRDERELVDLYYQEMKRGGVDTYSREQLWHDYRRGAWLGLQMAVTASTLAKRTDRGDRMFMRMLRGAAEQMLEHDTLLMA